MAFVPPAGAQDEEDNSRVPGGQVDNADAGREGETIFSRVESYPHTPGRSGPGSSGSDSGALSPDNSNWTPPPCWYEPYASPEEVAEMVKRWKERGFIGNVVGVIFQILFEERKGEWENYNLEEQGNGMFWMGVVNPNRKDEPGANDCDKPPFWVENGVVPDEPLAVDPLTLAEFAYDEIEIPDTEVEIKPEAEQKVNLPSWIWLDEGTFQPVSVTAELPDTALTATTTATPIALRLDPGTQDADLHPSSGECGFNDDGSIGTPYSSGRAEETPPCGVTYRRSTEDTGPYELDATVLWKVTWEGSTGEGGRLPDGAFSGTQDITVQEVQTVVR